MLMRSAPLALAAAIFLSGPSIAQTARATDATGQYTYPGPGTVNTHWIETPGGGLVVIDVQRDLAHAREALAAIKAVGKPVRAILVTHGHPDHYSGLGLFKAAFPDAVIWSSRTTAETIRTDPYKFNKLMQDADPSNAPKTFLVPDHVLAGDTTLTIDGLTIVAREFGKAEANSATVYYLPQSGDLYVGDLVLNHLHALYGEAATSEWLAALDRLDVVFPNARTIHPGHGASGRKATLLADERSYVVTTRQLAMTAFLSPGTEVERKARAVAAIKRRFPYEHPAGLRAIVPISVDGLFTEFAKPEYEPVR